MLCLQLPLTGNDPIRVSTTRDNSNRHTPADLSSMHRRDESAQVLSHIGTCDDAWPRCCLPLLSLISSLLAPLVDVVGHAMAIEWIRLHRTAKRRSRSTRAVLSSTGSRRCLSDPSRIRRQTGLHTHTRIDGSDSSTQTTTSSVGQLQQFERSADRILQCVMRAS